jgi:ATP-dependent Clp protease adapter protein ClpS
MSTTTPPQTIRKRLDRQDWQARVLVADDATFPLLRAVEALVDVLAIPQTAAFVLCQMIERHGEFAVWHGSPEGAEHNAARLRARGLSARVA